MFLKGNFQGSKEKNFKETNFQNELTQQMFHIKRKSYTQAHLCN